MTDFEELKKCFEGKTITSVDPSEAPESIAKFTFSDGTAVRIHATDLGYWIEPTVATDSVYDNFDTLIKDAYHHQYRLQPNYGFNAPVPKVKLVGDLLQVTHVDGKCFQSRIDKFSDWEKSVCRHPKGMDLIAQAIEFGDCYNIVFMQEDCPAELKKDSANRIIIMI